MNTGNPLLLHNVGGRFTTNFISHVYTKMRVPEMYRQETSALTDAQLATWISDLKVR